MTVAELRKMEDEYRGKNGVAAFALSLAAVACGRERGGYSNDEVDLMLKRMALICVCFELHTNLSPEVQARLMAIRSQWPKAETKEAK